MGISEAFGTEYYAWRLDKAQNLYQFYKFFLYDSLGPKCFDTPKLNTAIAGKYLFTQWEI